MDVDNEFDEYDLLEAEYAQQLEILDELEGDIFVFGVMYGACLIDLIFQLG